MLCLWENGTDAGAVSRGEDTTYMDLDALRPSKGTKLHFVDTRVLTPPKYFTTNGLLQYGCLLMVLEVLKRCIDHGIGFDQDRESRMAAVFGLFGLFLLLKPWIKYLYHRLQKRLNNARPPSVILLRKWRFHEKSIQYGKPNSSRDTNQVYLNGIKEGVYGLVEVGGVIRPGMKILIEKPETRRSLPMLYDAVETEPDCVDPGTSNVRHRNLRTRPFHRIELWGHW